jgi:hypothetical protein
MAVDPASASRRAVAVTGSRVNEAPLVGWTRRGSVVVAFDDLRIGWRAQA